MKKFLVGLLIGIALNYGLAIAGISYPPGPVMLTGISTSIGGSVLAVGSCATTTVNVPGANSSMAAIAVPSVNVGPTFTRTVYVSAQDTVSISVCAAVLGTPTAATYNVRVFQ